MAGNGSGDMVRVTAMALVVNLVISAMKTAGGILYHSNALLADGIHSLTDCVTDGAILIGVRHWSRPCDESHPHGHARIETLISGFIGFFILTTSILMAWRSFLAVADPPEVPPGRLAFVIAVVGLATKSFLSRWTMSTAIRLKSTALAANALHQRSDAYGSIPVVVVVLASRLNESLMVLDGLGGFVVSLVVFRMGWKVFRDATWRLSDAGAPAEVVEILRDRAFSVPGVMDVHDVRTRYQGSNIQIDMHVTVLASLPVREAYRILTGVEREVRNAGYGVVDVMVRLEPADDDNGSSSEFGGLDL